VALISVYMGILISDSALLNSPVIDFNWFMFSRGSYQVLLRMGFWNKELPRASVHLQTSICCIPGVFYSFSPLDLA
jgi:hypothetical protein